MTSYDQEIRAHYAGVANEAGLSPTSTMADDRTRQLETDLILQFIELAIERQAGRARRLIFADFGCGNGYTLSVLAEHLPSLEIHGFEYTPELRALAGQRFVDDKRASIHPADIREASFTKGLKIDIAIVQRVLINLLDPDHQRQALCNLIDVMQPGGHILFIEGFQSGLDALNAARSEFELKAVPPAKHNLMLPDDFFERELELSPFAMEKGKIARNFLSTHYFVTRVLHEIALNGRAFTRNSMFAQFMSQALAQNIGDFSPVKAMAFEVKR